MRPKYGNDIDDVDYIVRDSMNWYYDELTKYTAHGRNLLSVSSDAGGKSNLHRREDWSDAGPDLTGGSTTADNVSRIRERIFRVQRRQCIRWQSWIISVRQTVQFTI